MKVVLAGDIHGALPAAQKLVDAYAREEADTLVLLGDLYYHGPRNTLPDGYNPMGVAQLLNGVDGIFAVKGNCDAEIDETISRFPILSGAELEIGDGKVYLTHGQKYNEDCMPSVKYDLLAHAHTHLYAIKTVDGTTVVNPGSVGIPKGGNPATYAVVTETEVVIKTLDGLPVERAVWTTDAR